MYKYLILLSFLYSCNGKISNSPTQKRSDIDSFKTKQDCLKERISKKEMPNLVEEPMLFRLSPPDKDKQAVSLGDTCIINCITIRRYLYDSVTFETSMGFIRTTEIDSLYQIIIPTNHLIIPSYKKVTKFKLMVQMNTFRKEGGRMFNRSRPQTTSFSIYVKKKEN